MAYIPSSSVAHEHGQSIQSDLIQSIYEIKCLLHKIRYKSIHTFLYTPFYKWPMCKKKFVMNDSGSLFDVFGCCFCLKECIERGQRNSMEFNMKIVPLATILSCKS